METKTLTVGEVVTISGHGFRVARVDYAEGIPVGIAFKPIILPKQGQVWHCMGGDYLIARVHSFGFSAIELKSGNRWAEPVGNAAATLPACATLLAESIAELPAGGTVPGSRN